MTSVWRSFSFDFVVSVAELLVSGFICFLVHYLLHSSEMCALWYYMVVSRYKLHVDLVQSIITLSLSPFTC